VREYRVGVGHLALSVKKSHISKGIKVFF